ncbi:MAG TPA: ABC transporter permease subunit [Clostridia bacterium]
MFIQQQRTTKVKSKRPSKKILRLKKSLPLHFMMAPGTILMIIFNILPIVGLYMAFAAYKPIYGKSFLSSLFNAPFVGFYFFETVFSRPDFGRVMFNTVYIAIIKIVLQTVLGILIALLLNEMMSQKLKKFLQTVYFLPYFLSWALLGSIVNNLFSINGPINAILAATGLNRISFLSSNSWFRTIIIGSDLWKNLGYQAIYFLAAISYLDSTLYEAARIDGANRFKLCYHITIPGIMPIIILISVLNLGNIMNAGFEQILTLYNEIVYKTGDIIDTMAYRIGLINKSTYQFSLGTAIGLFKSLISCALFSIAYIFAAKKLDYKIF